ncbi:hypothetical protein AMTR_s00170p00026920 [Amborella trichopoda]|uniref:Uncharacterized protein n=1 Tax=Amborella trichopoda TaxID=13333 RepID=W1NUJ2_AMBTC|nr:hypothetical protein AMTR_s00170p00026920 [Amborella trichopoda]
MTSVFFMVRTLVGSYIATKRGQSACEITTLSTPRTVGHTGGHRYKATKLGPSKVAWDNSITPSVGRAGFIQQLWSRLRHEQVNVRHEDRTYRKGIKPESLHNDL